MRDDIPAITSFPSEIIQGNWQCLAAIVFGWTKQYPHALARPCCQFCAMIAADLVEIECERFQEFTLTEFADRESFRSRVFVPILVGALAASGGPPFLVGALFRKVTELAQDPVLDVRAAVIHNLSKTHKFYAIRRDGIREREVIALFMAMGARKDEPHILTTWADLDEAFRAPVAVPTPPIVYQSQNLTGGLPRLVLGGRNISEAECGQAALRKVQTKGFLASSSLLTRPKLKAIAAAEGGLL
jgi:hypothetical protein